MLPKVEDLLRNLTLGYSSPVDSVAQGMKRFAGCGKNLEAVHIFLEWIDPSCFRKKDYYHIERVPMVSLLDEWVYEHLISNETYARYLDRYRPLKEKLRYDDIDEYILSKHYRPKAARILSREKKSFDLKRWTKPRFGYAYERKSSLVLKDGTPWSFDFRTSVESLFILKKDGDKQILAVGGSGGSSRRLDYTMFTAIFYLLSKSSPIPHYLLRYNPFNEFEYLKTIKRVLVTPAFGMNYSLDQKLTEEIHRRGAQAEDMYKRQPS